MTSPPPTSTTSARRCARRIELDVVARVLAKEYDAGAVSGRVLDTLQPDDGIDPADLRVLWTSPGYSHCCFTARPRHGR